MLKRSLGALLFVGAMSQSAFAKFPMKPESFEFCFRPYGDCKSKLVEFIGSAKESVEIAIYSFDSQDIFDAIQEIVERQKISNERRIKIHVVVDSGKAEEKKSLVNDLAAMGIKVRYGVQDGHMHNKFIIIDRKMVQLGSSNYSAKSFTINQENFTFSSHAELVTRYSAYYDKLWESSKKL